MEYKICNRLHFMPDVIMFTENLQNVTTAVTDIAKTSARLHLLVGFALWTIHLALRDKISQSTAERDS